MFCHLLQHVRCIGNSYLIETGECYFIYVYMYICMYIFVCVCKRKEAEKLKSRGEILKLILVLTSLMYPLSDELRLILIHVILSNQLV